MLARDIVDQLHDQYGLADARAAEQADLAALGVGRDQVDDLDARFQYLRRALLLVVGGRRSMDWPALHVFRRRLVVNGIAQQVEHSAQRFLTNGYRDRPAHIHRRHAAAQTVRRIHGDTAHHIVADVLRDLGGDLRAVVIDLDRIQQIGKPAAFEANIKHRADDLHDPTGIFLCHNQFSSFSPSEPAMISVSSCVIEA